MLVARVRNLAYCLEFFMLMMCSKSLCCGSIFIRTISIKQYLASGAHPVHIWEEPQEVMMHRMLKYLKFLWSPNQALDDGLATWGSYAWDISKILSVWYVMQELCDYMSFFISSEVRKNSRANSVLRGWECDIPNFNIIYIIDFRKNNWELGDVDIIWE